MLLVAIAAMVFVSCSKDDDTDPSVAGGEGVITMTTEGVDINFEIQTAKADEIITIDWGDGQAKEYKSVKIEDFGRIWCEVKAEHTYSQTGTHTIKVSGALTELDCGQNELTSLDVSENSALTELSCSQNELTSLDVSKCTALTYLWCSYNELTSLDVSKNTALVVLYCGGNELTSLDVSKCTALTELHCDENLLTSKALNKIFTDLPKGKTLVGPNGSTSDCRIYVSDNPGSGTCNESIAENKGWHVFNY